MSRRPLRENLSDKALDVVGVPKHMRDKSISDFDTYGMRSLSDVKKYITNYLSDMDSRFIENKGLFLYGSNGVGKTFIGSMIAAPILEDLLRYREDKHLPTIVCTNLDIDTVEERYGYSIVSLIKGNMTPILIEGEDKRSNYYVDRTTS